MPLPENHCWLSQRTFTLIKGWISWHSGKCWPKSRLQSDHITVAVATNWSPYLRLHHLHLLIWITPAGPTDVADATEEESIILDGELHLENNRAPRLFRLSAFWAVSSLLKTLKSATDMVTSITCVLWMQAAGWLSLALRVDHRLEKSSYQTISAFLLPLKWPLSDLLSNVHDWVLSSQKPVR